MTARVLLSADAEMVASRRRGTWRVASLAAFLEFRNVLARRGREEFNVIYERPHLQKD